MPNTLNRSSLNTSMSDRYSSMSAGGAFDAKRAGKPSPTTTNYLSDAFGSGFTVGGENTSLPKKDSIFLSGHTTKRYHS